MITAEEVPAHIKSLRERSGLTMKEMARVMKLAGGSSYQNYETRERHTYMKLVRVRRLVPVLVGKGNPSIKRSEVMMLAGIEDDDTIDRGAVMVCIEVGILDYLRAERGITTEHDPAVFKQAARRIAEVALQLTEEKRAGRVRSDGELRAYAEGLIQSAIHEVR